MSQESRNGYSQQYTGTRRNIRIGKRRTSVKLEPEMWEALIEIGLRTKKTINQICTEVHKSSLGANHGHRPLPGQTPSGRYSGRKYASPRL